MKKTSTTLFALLAALQFSYAQWTNGTDIYNTNSGNVGVGTTSPAVKLDVVAAGDNANGILRISSTSSSASGTLIRKGFYAFDSQDGSGAFYSAWGMRYDPTAGWVRTYTGSNNYLPYLQLSTSNTIAFGGAASNLTSNNTPVLKPAMTIDVGTGNVGIGTTDTKGYLFAVNGSAVATSMKVKLQSSWPDFVFLKDYKLPTLTEVKTYIDKNQHLPDMPTAAEVHTNGLDLGEMNRLLLKKVEELTLYLIEKERELSLQNTELKDLQAAKESQQRQIELINNQMNVLKKTFTKSKL